MSNFFQQISTSGTNFNAKFYKFQKQISVVKSTTNNLSKTLFCIKIDQQMAELSPKEYWKTCETWIKSWFCNGFFYSIWTRNKRLSSLFWRYLSHLLVDFDARYRFRKVISCRKHDWNLDLKFAKFRVKVGPRSRNLLKKVRPLTIFSWITLKFNVFCWDKYYFSESLGSKLIENYDELKNIS